MKTIKEIANDCGLESNSLRPSTLEKILNGNYTGSTLYEESLYEIIGALYRRIEKLEAEKAEEGFTCMREGADNVLTQMGAEPPVHVSGEAYRNEWNCPSCGGESEDDGGGARRCHPCSRNFTPEEGVTMHATVTTEVVFANTATVQRTLEALTHDPKSDAWTYSRYRATLRKDGRVIAIVTPDGKNALSEDAEAELLHALNRPN